MAEPTLDQFTDNPEEPASPAGGAEAQNGPSLDYDSIDIKELYAVKLQRAFRDKFIAHTPSIGYAPDGDHYLYELARKARFARALIMHPFHRTGKATWPEVAIYCMSASGDARTVDERFVRVFQRALLEVMEMKGITEDALPSFVQELDGESGVLAGHPDAQRMADGLRAHIKDAQDSHFVSVMYDGWDVERVPKRFWTRFGGVSASSTNDGAGGSVEADKTVSDDESSELKAASLDEFL